jgi:hypothetical protein
MKMTVYIVLGIEYDMSTVLGVFSSREVAERFAAGGFEFEFNCIDIEEHEVQ